MDKPESIEKDPVDLPSSGEGSTSTMLATPAPTKTDVSQKVSGTPAVYDNSKEYNMPSAHQGSKLDELWAYVMSKVGAAKEWWKHHTNGGTGQNSPTKDG